jgi:hypothetical protein
MKFPRRTGAKIQMTCNQCREACPTKDGDWHEGEKGQIFLCRDCELKLPLSAKLRVRSAFALERAQA